MSRQPFFPLLERHRGGKLEIGTHTIGRRPELEAIIGHCLTVWPTVEAELALTLAQLLGAENDAVLAVFQTIRRSTAQREAVQAAAEATLESADLELLTAMLDVHKSIETERNFLAHGHLGTYSLLPEIIVCATTRAYVRVKAKVNLANVKRVGPVYQEFLDDVFVYRKEDLEAVRDGALYCGNMWVDAIRWLRARIPQRDELYRQLCGQSRIAQALATIRQKNTP